MARVEFPYRIRGPEKLPELFASVAPPAEDVIFVPPQGFGRFRDRVLRGRRGEDTARALGFAGGRIWVLEEGDQEVNHREIPLEDILEVEIGHVLLHAWVAFTPDEENPIRIDFNAVTLPLFEDFTDRVLEEMCGSGWESNRVEVSGVGEFPLKFRNALREQLLVGEEPHAVAFAPAVWERRFLMLRRRLVSATVLAATDRRLLVIEEGEAVRDSTYGSTAYSIPRQLVNGLSRTTEGLVLSLHTRGGRRERRIPFSEPENAAEIIKAITGGNP